MDGQQEIFANRNDVVRHLKAVGFKISKSKLYQDARAGRLRFQADGSVLDSDLAEYIASLQRPAALGLDEDWRAIMVEVRRSLRKATRLIDLVVSMRSGSE